MKNPFTRYEATASHGHGGSLDCQLTPYDTAVRADSQLAIRPRRRKFGLRGAFAAQCLRVIVP
jgi:hypothetical protein